MRLFIAIPLSNTLKDAVLHAQGAFRAAGLRGNYTSRENLHVTLAFLGEYGDPEGVLEAMEAVNFAPFSLTMDRLGCFGDLWWTGFADCPELTALVRRLRRALAEAGIPFDRKKFSPHVTMLRRGTGPAGGWPPRESLSPATMTVDRFCLYSSTRGKGGMIYTELGCVEGR